MTDGSIERLKRRCDTWSLNSDAAWVSVRLGDLRAALDASEGSEDGGSSRDHDPATCSTLEFTRQKVCDASAVANERFGQWMPQAWLDHFMNAYEGK